MPVDGDVVKYEFTGKAHVFHVVHDLDLFNAPTLGEKLTKIDENAAPVIVNLLDCKYVESAGVTVLLQSRKRLGDRLRVVVRGGSNVERVLRITKLDSVVPLISSLDEALK